MKRLGAFRKLRGNRRVIFKYLKCYHVEINLDLFCVVSEGELIKDWMLQESIFQYNVKKRTFLQSELSKSNFFFFKREVSHWRCSVWLACWQIFKDDSFSIFHLSIVYRASV